MKYSKHSIITLIFFSILLYGCSSNYLLRKGDWEPIRTSYNHTYTYLSSTNNEFLILGISANIKNCKKLNVYFINVDDHAINDKILLDVNNQKINFLVSEHSYGSIISNETEMITIYDPYTGIALTENDTETVYKVSIDDIVRENNEKEGMSKLVMSNKAKQFLINELETTHILSVQNGLANFKSLHTTEVLENLISQCYVQQKAIANAL